MFGKIAKILFMLTTTLPVFLILWFKAFSVSWDCRNGIFDLLTVIFLIVLLYVLIKTAKRNLEKLPIPIKIIHVSNTNKEIIPFLFLYIIPLLHLNTPMLIFSLIFFFCIILITNANYFNPMLGIFGYRQYEITIENGTTFLLITKKKLINVNQIKEISQITDNMLIDADK